MSDLRTSIGLFFSITGVLLLIVSAVGPAVTAPLTTVNVNLYCGAAMLLFGSVMLWLARRSL